MSGFLGRWSRLKAESGKGKAVAVEIEQAAPEPAPDPAPVAEAAPAPEPVEPPADLPPVESLGCDSDYSRFLQEDVPEQLRKLALRKLWATDPVLSAVDPLDLHNLDYSFSAVPEVVATAYRVGKGLAEKLERVGGGQDQLATDLPSAEEEAPKNRTASGPANHSPQKLNIDSSIHDRSGMTSESP